MWVCVGVGVCVCVWVCVGVGVCGCVCVLLRAGALKEDEERAEVPVLLQQLCILTTL